MSFSSTPVIYAIQIICSLIFAFMATCLAGWVVNLILPLPLKMRLKKDGVDRKDWAETILRLRAKQQTERQKRKEQKEKLRLDKKSCKQQKGVKPKKIYE